MNTLRNIIILLCLWIGVGSVFAALPVNWDKAELKKSMKAELRADCAQATQNPDLAVNNVRARLMNGGDMWWDLDGEGRYIIPKNGTSSGDFVTSMFSGAVWIGGFDEGGNLKLAAQTYRGSNANDFWPGPLTEEGLTDAVTCLNWDKVFRVTGEEISEHLENVAIYGNAYPANLIPENVKYWPGIGNKFFTERYDFELPDASQGLGNFWDADFNGVYNPLEGDYPIIDIKGCGDPQYPDEMLFWIYNDNGGVHSNSDGSTPIRMEVQVQAFGYQSQDELNNMTFYRYKLINRAIEAIDSCYFAMWVDPDLGCAFDDYVGSDTSRSLMYVYNLDAVDGNVGDGSDCQGGNPTYGNEVPMIGVDYFRGPLSEFGEELGMSSFTYYLNATEGVPPGMTDPEVDVHFYNYLTGRWKFGDDFTYGGTGYQDGTEKIKYAFTDPPMDPNGWSMCSVTFGSRDPRTIQATGPLRLLPGALNELIIGVPWVPNVEHPCPSLEKILKADVKAQGLFDNCFDILDGPDAPDLDFIELENRLIVLLSNKDNSNNINGSYQEAGIDIPPGFDKTYRFQGYRVYQLVSANAENTPDGRKDPSNARLVLESDIVDSVVTIYNWVEQKAPVTQEPIYTPIQEVVGQNEGIVTTALLTQDAFTGDQLINNKRYYYTVVAYAFNEYKKFDFKTGLGQATPYIEGRNNIEIYEVIPRITSFVELNSVYGQGPEVKKIDGVGVGNNFVRITEETENAILDGSFEQDKVITYLENATPIDVKVVNPLDVISGTFRLEIYDADMNDDVLDSGTARYRLTHIESKDTIESQKVITSIAEDFFGKWGISLNVKQLPDAGSNIGDNGAIGSEVTYKGGGDEWFGFYTENELGNYIRTTISEGGLSGIDDGGNFTDGNIKGPFYPWKLSTLTALKSQLNVSPGYTDNSEVIDILVASRNKPLASLKNVDIVFTSDKSKWSRCPIFETGNESYATLLEVESIGGATNFSLRESPSVTKDDLDGDGLPDVDNSLGNGFGWFPGYAIDVETGERLVVFFGENSYLSKSQFPLERFFIDEELQNSVLVGGDMMWNPSSIYPELDELGFNSGGHYIYTTNVPYSEEAAIKFGNDLDAVSGRSALIIESRVVPIQWVCTPNLRSGAELLSYADGLIPNEMKVSMRVNNPFAVREMTGENNGYPLFEFTLNNYTGSEVEGSVKDDDGPLSNIGIVPNPYYGRSSYENSSFSNVVKITNLPPQCEVNIYSLDGRFIRRFERNTDYNYENNPLSNSVPRTFYTPDIEWDIKNNAGIPVSSGVYLFHIKSEKYGEVVRKWFAINRKFDPSIF